MPTNHIIKGKTCRYYRDGSLYISKDGTLAAMPKTKVVLPLKQDQYGNVYVEHGWGYYVSIAKAVITCFCIPKPQDGKPYVIKHKDGNKQNCSSDNLEWELEHYQQTTKNIVEIDVDGTKIEVHKDGTAFLKKGKQLTITDDSYDADIDLFKCIGPHISVPRDRNFYSKTVFMDDLMKNAGFVNGDDVVLSRPVILHRDNNRMNFASDNLEWVEDTDPRYIAYQTKKREEEHQRNIDLNPRKKLHPGM